MYYLGKKNSSNKISLSFTGFAFYIWCNIETCLKKKGLFKCPWKNSHSWDPRFLDDSTWKTHAILVNDRIGKSRPLFFKKQQRMSQQLSERERTAKIRPDNAGSSTKKKSLCWFSNSIQCLKRSWLCHFSPTSQVCFLFSPYMYARFSCNLFQFSLSLALTDCVWFQNYSISRTPC